MIVCGWCASLTSPDTCTACGRDPILPWSQRGQEPPDEAEQKRIEARRRLSEARRELGPDASSEAIAERVGVSPRTVARWRELAGS